MPLHQISVTPAERSKRVQDKAMRHEPKEMMHTMSPAPHSVPERCASRASTLSYNKDFCRICHCDGDNDTPLISPCQCAGSLRFVHQSCLQQWIKSSDIKCCELCKFTFIMQTKTKPFSMWEKLDMASSERRKLLCSVGFHVVALTCVVWSLYVLIERTTEEVQSGILEWPFWTKLIVVAIGVTGGVVFMYVQCKVYVQLCRRWRAYNRVIYVQNVPEKTLPADLEAGRGRLSMCDSRSVLENSFPSIDGCHWPLAANVDQSRRTSDDRRASDAVRWPLAAALDQSRRASEDVHGRVHVTIERSSSSSPMLPPGDVLTERQLVFPPLDGARSSLAGSPDRSTSSCAIIPSSSDCSEMNPAPPIAVDAQS